MSKPARSTRPAGSQQAPRKSDDAAAAAASSSSGDASGGDELRLLLDWHHVGCVIGKGGATVRQIREDSGCQLNIIAPAPNAPSPQQIDRICTIKGSIEQETKAIYLIAQTIAARAAERRRSGADSGERGRSNSNADAADGSTAIKLLVHRAAVGAVIGKGGASIRDLQASTGARIQVSSEALGNSTDKTVTISGTPEVLETAVRRVLTMLAESPLRSGTKTVHFVPGPTYFDYDAQAGTNPANGTVTGTGPISIQKIAIPTICAGCVIGRGGTIIRSLREQSGTNISIADPDPATPDERVVTITGTPGGIQTAVYLIRQCVESYVPPQQGGEQEEQQGEEQQGEENKETQ